MTTSSTNYTGLYSGNVSGVIPNTAYGNANVVSLLAVGTDGANTVGNITATGNVSANYFIGNGSQLTGIVSSSYGNAQVASFLSAFGSNTISTTGNVTSGNLLTGGAVSATGNVTGAYIFGNGSQLTGLPATYGNANVTTLLAAFGSNSISTTGNITAGNFAGNGSQLTAIAGANVSGTVANATYATSAGSATTAGTVTANAQPNITSTGTLSTLSVSGNTTSGNLLTPGMISASGNITTAGYFVGNFAGNITGNLTVPGANTDVLFNNQGNAGASTNFTFNSATNVMNVTGSATVSGNITGGNVSTAGNVTGAYILGNGSQLTALTGANVSGTVANATYALNANAATYATNAVQANTANTANAVAGANVSGTVANATYALTSNAATYASVATFADTANAVAGANVSGTVANAAYATSAGSATTAVTANTVTDPAQANITSVGTLTSVSVSGNTTTGNLLTAGVVSATGNITGSYIFGNGSQLTGLPAGYSNANVTTLLAAFGSNTISTTGNVDTGNLGVSQNAVILGNLTVQGTTITVNSNTVTINDKFINVANNAATPGDANGGGIGVGPVGSEYATLTFNSAATAWNTNIPLSVTGNISGGNVLASGAVSAVGNITGSYIIGNGSLLTDINASNIVGSYGNAQVASFLNAFGSNSISTTGNITSAYISGNGSLLTSLTGANVTGTVANATYSTNAGTATFANTANAVAGANVSGTVANATYALNSNAATYASVATFADTANAVAGANVTGTVANATYALNSNAATFAGTVTTNAQPNITSVGILTAVNTSGAVSATGNITGSYIFGNGSQLTGLPAGYSNADVTTLLAAFGSNTISTTGNITAGYFVGNGSALGSITGGNVSGTVANATFATSAGSATTANTVTNGAQANITSVGTLTSLSVTGNANISGNINMPTADANITFGAVAIRNYNNRFYVNTDTDIAGRLSASGNITGSYIFGNGSQLTGLPAGYSNADVTTLLAAFGSNTISTTGNITAGNLVGIGSLTSLSVTGNANVSGNINLPTADANITFGAVAIRNYNNRLYVNTDTDIAGQLSASGNVIGNNLLTAGVISATGNITGAYILGNGSQLTGLPAVYGNANVVANLAALGTNPVSTTGNVTAGYFIGNGALLTSITASNIVGAYGNANVSNFLANGFGSNTIVTTGNITGGNLLTGGASGNIVGADYVTANYFVGNGYYLSGLAAVSSNSALALINGTTNLTTANGGNANLTIGGTSNVVVWTTTGQSVTGLISASGNVTGGNVLTGGVISATSNITGGNILTGGLVSATGNINGANIIAAGLICATGNITTGQSTIIGTANTTGGVGNIILSGKNIATDMPRNPDSGNTTFVDPSRIIIGTGYNGNTNAGIIYNTPSAARLWVSDAYNRGNTALGSRAIVTTDFVTLTANVTQSFWRLNGIAVQPVVGGGPSGNTVNVGPFAIVGITSSPQIGGGLTGNLTALGNTTVQHAAGIYGGTQVAQGSNIGNSLNIVSFTSHTGGGGVSSFANSVLGFTNYSISNVTPTTYIGYHMPSNVATSYGVSLTNSVRAASNYYFLRNDDAAAQAQIGSLRSYSEYNYTNTATSGAVTIDKTNAQVQQVNLTGNVTSLTYSNFVSSASDGTNTDEQADTVTIIFNQGATGGYSVTFPSGAAYKYAGGTNTLVATTANSVSLVAITAIRISGTTTYLTTISPAFT